MEGDFLNNIEFTKKLVDIAKNCKTLYVMGCFGAPLNEKNKERYCKNHSYNKKSARTKMIREASEDTFGFDCVNLIKGILWGWNGDKSKNYGGAVYKSNNVPDTNADGMIALCKELSTDFSKIEIGEAVWLKGHIGVYIGDGLCVECTPQWKNSVQITACNCDKTGYPRRNWKKHGYLPYISYEKIKEEKTMRSFKLKEEMNIRSTPNGLKIGTAPEGAVISGTEILVNNGIDWLKTSYNGIEGYIAVSEKYASEVEKATDLEKAICEAIKILSEAVKL